MGETSKEEGKNILKRSRWLQYNKKYTEAIKGYDMILSNPHLPIQVVNEAKVCKLLAEEKLPVLKSYSFSPEYIHIAEDGRSYYKDNKCSYILYGEYSPFKKYFNHQQDWVYIQSPSFKFDKNGIPMVKYDEKFYYNAVTICQYALHLYDKYMDGQDNKDKFLNIADFLIKSIKKDGSLRYEFKYNHYECLNEGWASSMSQGQALSVFARAYHLTEDPKYIKSGQKVLRYLLTPISEGGVMDNLGTLDKRLKNKIFFQQYINSTSTYTLNGHIFTLIGLYDWSNVRCLGNMYYCNTAKRYWNKGLETLKYILPYYDMGNFTSYDLNHMVKSSVPSSSDFYHAVHIEQMNVLYDITKEEYFKNIRDMWISYVKK
ncbi:D-glucuronyl C5-epimerase family protein [Clostridium sp. Mt-5]|uniref:D-glucuronyl C5-epimerase family protein n=1 Tax=Clostridium moutaii TaxID=3240932 RepID=A0ABV4BPI0_9CLOT